MKTPAFWYRAFGWQAALLAPLGQAYRAAGKIRRFCATPYHPEIPTICIGNVVAGGAGKTPTALALAELLQRRGARPAFVTRGYGGLESGPLRVDTDRHNVRDVGDEALVLASAAPCWIGRDRAAAIRAAESHATHIFMDDGLQNPNVAPTASLLVIDGPSGIGNGQIIPAGPLRETLNDALNRVSAVLIIGEDRHRVIPRLNKPVLRAYFRSSLPDNVPIGRACLAFSGIGRPEKFYACCRDAGLNVAETRDFPDHHLFSEQELKALTDAAKARDLQLVTTAKDWVRLPNVFRAHAVVLPVELAFEDDDAVLRTLGFIPTVV